jgi:hypothetical protein
MVREAMKTYAALIKGKRFAAAFVTVAKHKKLKLLPEPELGRRCLAAMAVYRL